MAARGREWRSTEARSLVLQQVVSPEGRWYSCQRKAENDNRWQLYELLAVTNDGPAKCDSASCINA